MANPGVDEGHDGAPPLARAAAWYRLSLMTLAAAFLVQVFPGWFFPGGALAFVWLSLGLAVAAPCLAIRGMFMFRSETSRLGSAAKNVEARRRARALRTNSGPIALVSVISAGIILAGLLTLQSVAAVMQTFSSAPGSGPSPQVTPGASTAHVAITLSWILWLCIMAGLVLAFFRVRKFQDVAGGFLNSAA